MITYLFFYITIVSCNCPCKFGDFHGLSNTEDYKTQCFENEVFQIQKSFKCQFYETCEGTLYRNLKYLATNPCKNNECENDSKCQKYSFNKYTCECSTGFTGLLCDKKTGKNIILILGISNEKLLKEIF